MAVFPGSPDSPSESDAGFRWQTLFQQTSEPLFLLNRRGRILFVNRAWETLTGLGQSEVKRHICRRRPRRILTDKLEIILGAMAPPRNVADGQPGQARRLLSLEAAPAWWHVCFFPLAGGDGLRGILGKITVLPRPQATPGQPLSEKMVALRQQHWQRCRLEELASTAPAMNRLRSQIRLAAQTRLPALLQGPPGTGKRWVARAIHQLGPENEKPFACLDCSRLPPQVIADLLLRDRPRFASVYLHDVAALPRDLQERLQQLLTEGGPRICAGLEANPQELIRSGQLLHELYCRLSPLVLDLPPLKERMDDFEAWIERFLPRASLAAERQVRGLRPEATQLLRAYDWPGNLRELYDVLVGACLRAKGNLIEPGDLPFHLRRVAAPVAKPLNLDAILEEVERRLIVQALHMANNNKSRAAELLTIWRARLLRRMAHLGITDQ